MRTPDAVHIGSESLNESPVLFNPVPIDTQTKTYHRVQLDFSKEALEVLDGLVDKLNASSRAEVVRHALAVLVWMHNKQVQENFQIVAIGKDATGNDRVIEPVFTFLPSK